MIARRWLVAIGLLAAPRAHAQPTTTDAPAAAAPVDAPAEAGPVDAPPLPPTGAAPADAPLPPTGAAPADDPLPPTGAAPADDPLPPTDAAPAAPTDPLPAIRGADPVARFPAGLDPATLCRADDHGCTDLDLDRVLDTTAAPAPGRLLAIASAYAAGFTYGNHASRLRGLELNARAEVTAERWRGRLAYTLDQITMSDLSVSNFHDVLGGATVRLPTGRPAWLSVDGHVLVGATMGDGAAITATGGARVAGLDLEASLGSLWLDGDQGTTLSVRATRDGAWWRAWAEVRLNRAVVSGTATTRPALGGGLTLAANHLVSVEVQGLVGDHALSILDQGQVVEPVPDVEHASGRVLLWLNVGPRARVYLGASRSSAATSSTSDYTLTSGFAGLTLSF
jgi:hypothetical protein